MLMGCVSFQVRCRVCSLIRILNTSLLCMQIHRRQGALNTGFNTLFMKVCSAHLHRCVFRVPDCQATSPSLCVSRTWLSSYVSIAVCSAYLTVKLRLHRCVFRVPDCQATSPSLCVSRTWLSSYISIAVCFAYLTVKLRLHRCVFRVPDCQAAVTELFQSPLYGSGTVFFRLGKSSFVRTPRHACPFDKNTVRPMEFPCCSPNRLDRASITAPIVIH